MVKVCAVPVQPLATGVTVMVATTGVVPEFTALKASILPVPLAAKPMEGVSLVQLYTVPETVGEEVKFTAAVIAPLHTT